MFFKQQISISEWILNDHDWSNDAENPVNSSESNHLKLLLICESKPNNREVATEHFNLASDLSFLW